MSHYFKSFCAENTLHHTTSPPHDHDLNPIAERCIGLISEIAAAIRYASGVSARYWPWIIGYAVDWHNATITAVGSSTADANISPHQRHIEESLNSLRLAIKAGGVLEQC